VQILERIPTPKLNKLTVKKGCDIYTVCFTGKNKTELVKIGQIYDHEINKIHEAYDPLTKKKTYDDEHSFIYVDMAMFVIKTNDIINQGE
jgi:hypothetical protein